MPKEFVHGCQPILSSPDGFVIEEGLLSIGWSNDAEHMQIATISRHPHTHETVNEGFYVDLDRRGINQAIRHLRRARDQAFGRDE